MRALVTGATGFIGLHLCRALVRRGDHVIALVRSPRKRALLPAGVEVLTGDLGLFARSGVALPEVEVVVHLAGVVAADTPEQYDAINFVAVREVVHALGRQAWTPRRLVFASSLAAAGPSPVDRPWTERDPLSPIDPYGEAKARAERVVARAPFPTTSFRPCIVLGPDDPASLTLYRAAKRGVGMRVGRRPQRLSFVDVRDVVRAIVALCDDSRPGHRTYYVSHPEPTDTDAIFAAIGRALGRRVRVLPLPGPLLRAAVPFATLGARLLGLPNQLDLKQYRQLVAPAFLCSSEGLRRELGWAALHGLDDAVANATRGYRASGVL